MLRAEVDKMWTDPREVLDIGLKSVRPEFTKCLATSDQSSRESQVIWLGGSTSTGITCDIPPHWMETTAAPIPPFRLHLSSLR